ncbi:heme peroxidase [Panaeolus papilionaceus]|nr:heme peroxidase [Panaeolus papilionaceus]
MTFVRLSTLIVIALGASVVSAAVATTPKGVVCKTGQHTAHAACCALFLIVDRLQKDLFDGAQCGEDVHSALRLSFHDAIGFSIHGGKQASSTFAPRKGFIDQLFSGVEVLTDLSLHLIKQRTPFPPTEGLIDVVTDAHWPLFLQSGLSLGDFVHLAAAVGTANCPGAPRLQFFMGRPAPKGPAPEHTVPEPVDSVNTILKRFEDAGFSAQEVVALLASHTIATVDSLDKPIPGTPFDSDSQFFLEILPKGKLLPGLSAIPKPGEVLSPLAGEIRLHSDFAIAHDPRTSCFWQEMVDDQAHMQSQFKDAMVKMQVLRQDTTKLIDCSDVIPVPKLFNDRIKFPATFGTKDLHLSMSFTKCGKRFPKLETVKGPAPTVAPVRSTKKDDLINRPVVFLLPNH